MDKYENHIDKLDNEIIELLSLRQKLLTNSKNFKVLELGGYNMKDNLISKLDYHIYLHELNNNLPYKKYFNNIEIDEYEEYESLNLSRIIKHSYIQFLFDLCEYGNDDKSDFTCNLDMEILFKLSERIHFGYEVIKFKYIENKEFYDKLFESSNSALILYYLSNSIYQPTYLDILKEKCENNEICGITICTFYKNIIIPYYNEIQLSFCLFLKKNNEKKQIKNNKNNINN